MSKADIKFVERMMKKNFDPRYPECIRLFDLAFRGAEAASKIKRLRSALRKIAMYEIEDGCPCSACHLSALARVALEGK